MSERRTPMRGVRGPRRERGLAAVEFVVTAPFIIFLVLAGAEVGRAFVQYTTLSYAVRESARFMSENSINGTTGVVAFTATNLTRARNLAVYGNILGTGAPKLPNFQTSHLQIVNAGNDNIQVTAIYPYQPMLGPALPDFGLGSGAVPLNFNMLVSITMRAIS